MRLYFVFTILFVLQLIHSQEKMEDKISFDFSLINDQQFIDSIPNFPNDLYEYYDMRITRDLDFGIKESILQGKQDYVSRTAINEKYKIHKVHILTKNSQVIAIIGKISYDGIKSYLNELEMDQFIQKHDSLYKSKTSKMGLISDILKEETYGYSCGIAPVIGGSLENNGFYFNDIKNKDVFRTWLRSYNVELQSYGVDALSYLYNNKPSFTIGKKEKDIRDQDNFIISHIKNRNSIINTCSGCLVGIYMRVF